MWLIAPVGTVRRLPWDDHWRPDSWGSAPGWTESDETISEAELRQGYYDVPDSGPDIRSSRRKKGTPAYWCFGFSAKHEFWLDPAKIDQVDW